MELLFSKRANTNTHSHTNPKNSLSASPQADSGGERFLLKPDCRSLLAHTENDSSHYTTKIQRNYVNTFSTAVTRLTTFGTTSGNRLLGYERFSHFKSYLWSRKLRKMKNQMRKMTALQTQC